MGLPPTSLPCRRHAAGHHSRPAAGIGLACAQSLGRAGAKVLVCDIDAEGIKKAEHQLRDEGIDVASIVCDVSIKQQARTVVARGKVGTPPCARFRVQCPASCFG